MRKRRQGLGLVLKKKLGFLICPNRVFDKVLVFAGAFEINLSWKTVPASVLYSFTLTRVPCILYSLEIAPTYVKPSSPIQFTFFFFPMKSTWREDSVAILQTEKEPDP